MIRNGSGLVAPAIEDQQNPPDARSEMESAVTEQNIPWEQDDIDPGWFFAESAGSVRSSISYRPGG
ncbi:hypothetical protein GA0061105_12052 [Rhizobium aethiopicum]|uniref:Uncharacterized protein n=1 Tax=Rhizobium aethiopicum TaxID=1138170 RepID=A0A1C3YAW0_9HYPH|nr:hypothetical protein GA0061105_12052 [Rhizobium aethiopicum]